MQKNVMDDKGNNAIKRAIERYNLIVDATYRRENGYKRLLKSWQQELDRLEPLYKKANEQIQWSLNKLNEAEEQRRQARTDLEAVKSAEWNRINRTNG